MKTQGVALAWMREQDWSRWLQMDPGFQPDYQHWLTRMEKAFAHYQAAGVPVLKVVIEPDEFLQWSRSNGRGTGSDDRACFAAWKMLQSEQRVTLQ